ncbi:MAG TPA: YfhO family protein, partial [Patescibacteria group bacterium]|nr:YfhO family protein [Patescibacteria group bacterium]
WLAALGFDLILDDLDASRSAKHGEAGKRLSGWIVGAALVMAAVAVMAGLMAWWLPGPFEALARAAITRVALPAQTGLISANLGPVRDDAIHLALLAGTLAATWVAARRGRLKCAVFAAIVPLALFADLMGASVGINYAGDPAIYRQTPPNATKLSSRPDPLFRLYVPDDTLGRDRGMYGSVNPEDFRWAANAMLYDLNLPWRLFSASDGDPMWSRRWKRFHRLIEQEGNDDARGRLLALANIGVVLKSGAGGSVDLFEVPSYLPRIYMAAGARRVKSPDVDALAAMLAPGWNPALEVLVEDDFTGEIRPAAADAITAAVRNVVYTSNTVTFEVDASRRGYLVLGDANYPGWEATVDSVATPVFTADYLFRGIDLPAGSHVVRFVYRPASVRWGAAGSAAGLVILACVGLAGRRRSGIPGA